MSGAPDRIDCQQALDRVYEYLDAELTAESEAAVRHHIVECAPCFQLFDFERAYLAFLEARTRAQHAPPEARRAILNTLLTEAGEQESS